MTKDNAHNSETLVEHFFRNEYGKIVAVISRYLGIERIETAEDIVQETLLPAVEYWKHKGLPPNPNAWLYTTAKNKTLNFLRKQKYEKNHEPEIHEKDFAEFVFSDEQISDEQLRMMLRCCNPSISEEIQITLILKILCGFSISEISSAFGTNNETINKRLVRGRKKLREINNSMEQPNDLNDNLEVLLKTIYILFNEGYFPVRKNQIVRIDLCLEAIRLAEIIVNSERTINKQDPHSLLALMYLNASRFKARVGKEDEVIEMEVQDRSLWNQKLINKGLNHLSEAQKFEAISKYLILTGISANHCIAPSFAETNWQEILSLYDILLTIENSPIVQLNRLIALSKVEDMDFSIMEIKKLGSLKEMKENYLYFSTLALLFKQSKNYIDAIKHYKIAIAFCKNERDKKFLRKKMNEVVLISDSHV